jgi:molybdenum cofactor cytidylyltransferase
MNGRYFALVPAAGSSIRMGEPKLLMPLAGRPLILHTIEAWQRSKVDGTIVVVRPDDAALLEVVRTRDAARVEVVIPKVPPPDMKASLQAALKHIERKYAPTSDDAFLVAPADMPRLSTAIINRLIERRESKSSRAILAPTLGGRRGHPVLFPWCFAAEVHALGAEAGLNTIVDCQQPVLVPCEDLVPSDEYPFADVDTPADYRDMTNDK